LNIDRLKEFALSPSNRRPNRRRRANRCCSASPTT
jgi:hypothetical protein